MAPIAKGCCLVAPAVPCRRITWLLVRHHAGYFVLDPGGLHHAAVDVHGPARQRKRIDLAHVDDFEGVLELVVLQLGRRHLHQAPADAIYEGLDAVIAQKRQLLLDFLRRLLAKFDILCRRVLVIWRGDDGLAANRARRQQHADRDDTEKASNMCVHRRPPKLALGLKSRRLVEREREQRFCGHVLALVLSIWTPAPPAAPTRTPIAVPFAPPAIAPMIVPSAAPPPTLSAVALFLGVNSSASTWFAL